MLEHIIFVGIKLLKARCSVFQCRL